MSLINDMLKDLEQRNANAPDGTPISGDVHSVPFSPASSARRWLWILLALLLLAAAVFAAMEWTKSQRSKPESATPLPAANVTQAPAPEVVAPAPAEPVAVTDPAPAGEVLVSQPVVDRSMVYSLDRELRNVPAQADAVPTPKEKAVRSPDPAAKAESLSQAATEAAAPLAEPEAAKPAQPPAKAKAAGSLPVKQVSPEQRSGNLYRQAVALIQQGRVAEATNLLTQALEAHPANHDARQLMVGTMVDAKRNAEAIALLREGLVVDPAQSGFSMALARLLVEAGDRRAAMGVMEKGLASAGEDAEYHAFMANLLQREERHAEAVQHYLVALRSNPAMPHWLIGIGISLQAENMLQDAIAAFQRALDTAQLSPELAQFAEQRLKQLRQQAR